MCWPTNPRLTPAESGNSMSQRRAGMEAPATPASGNATTPNKSLELTPKAPTGTVAEARMQRGPGR